MRKFFLCLCFWPALGLPAVAAEIKIDFSDFPTNQMPPGFHAALAGGGRPGDWKTVMDDAPSAFAPLTPQATAITRREALAQLDGDPTDERFPMLIYDKETFKDFKMTTQFKIVGGALEQMAGVVFRFQNESNFYVVRVSALGRNLRFYKVVNGVRGNFIGPDMSISTGVWHTLAIQCEGNQIICWFDDKLVMPPLQDNTFIEGKIGFWTKSDSRTHFGETTILYTPRVPMAQSLVQGVLEKQPLILGLRIYTLDEKGAPRVIAAKNEKEIGRPGTDAEKGAITKGAIYFGRGRESLAVTMPLNDRNGDPIAAVRVELKPFPGETQDTAVARARVIVRDLQAQVMSSQDLTQ